MERFPKWVLTIPLPPPWGRLPFDVASLLARSAKDAVDMLVSFKPDKESNIDEHDVVSALRQAFQTDVEWGFALADELCGRTDFDDYSHVSSPSCRSWQVPPTILSTNGGDCSF